MKYSFIAITLFLLVSHLFAQSDIESRITQLLKKMTVDEKIGQMTQVDYYAIRERPTDIIKYSFGSILWGGNSEISDISAQGWAELADSLQRISEKTRLKIPFLFGIDGVHGHHNVDGAVIFPHNIGLGATRNPELVAKVAEITATEIKSTGIHWDFAPCVAVARDERWGRTYESFSEHTDLVSQLGVAYVKGMQGKSLSDNTSTLACVKHYVADGGTLNGRDQGDAYISEEELRRIHLPPYIEAIKAGARSIMISFSSWNGNKMHGHKYLITNILKGELKFNGFVVSDWDAIRLLPGDFKDDIQLSINAGLDMAMVPFGPGLDNNYLQFVAAMQELIKEKKIPMSRIDDAVRRILRVKFEMGLFENRYVDKKLASRVGSKEHREVGREAVRQSLVLLKNEQNILPLSKNLKHIIVAGEAADNIGIQSGGWTIIWQGKIGNIYSGGTTILSAIRNTVSKNTTISYSVDGNISDSADVAVVVVGEEPYAETPGDRDDLSLSQKDIALIKKFHEKGIPVVTILISGRPMIINSSLERSTAFIAAWLPGSEGQGIADVLFGDYEPTGKLSFSWPRSMQQIPINVGDKNYDPLFPYGYGLTFKTEKALK